MYVCRHSKDRAEYPKLLDMLREKKELQTMREQEQDEPTTSPPLEASVAKEQSPATTTTTATQPQREHLVDSQLQHTTHHQEQPATEDTNKVRESLQVTQSLPTGVNNNIPEEKKFEKRASVSERRKMFETFSGGGGIQDKKLAIRGREKTPSHPVGSVTQDKDKNFNNSAQQSSTPLSHKQGDSNPPKRFSFVPKHVTPYDDTRLQPDSETKSVIPKRSSSDGRTSTTKNITNKSLYYSTSANEIREPQHLNDTKTTTDFHEHNKAQRNSPVHSKATTSPTSKKPQHVSSSQNLQDTTSQPQQEVIANHDESLHESVPLSTAGGNNTSVLSSSTTESVSSGFTTPDSSLLSERSNSSGFLRLHSEDAEAKRRVTAKKKREARRVTQPVDNDLLKLISKEDAKQEEREDELQIEAEELANKLKPAVSTLPDVCHLVYLQYVYWCVCVCACACVCSVVCACTRVCASCTYV